MSGSSYNELFIQQSYCPRDLYTRTDDRIVVLGIYLKLQNLLTNWSTAPMAEEVFRLIYLKVFHLQNMTQGFPGLCA